jgi:hypothetical protein
MVMPVQRPASWFRPERSEYDHADRPGARCQ